MKKLFFLLLFPLWETGGFSAFAQSHINIELLGATYTAPAVQFRISWNAIPAVVGQTHHAKIWLWVDFREIENNQPSGSWTRATVANPSPGTLEAGNDKGFWLQGTSGSYSQSVTVALTNIPENTIFNWCAYASDCPPNVTLDEGTYTFKGTTNFIMSEPARTLTTETIAKSNLTVTSSSTFTDATDCPGIGSLYCPYTGSDLYMDADHLCQQRASGAQNWEAYIKDTRDNKKYRIVYMPDNKWWLAQNLDYRSGAYRCGNDNTAYCDNYGIMLKLTDVIPTDICPVGWTLPNTTEMQAIASDNASVLKLRSTSSWRGSTNSSSAPGTDNYGMNIIATGFVDDILPTCYIAEYYASYHVLLPTDNTQGQWKPKWLSGSMTSTSCWHSVDWSMLHYDKDDDWAYIRCVRQL